MNIFKTPPLDRLDLKPGQEMDYDLCLCDPDLPGLNITWACDHPDISIRHDPQRVAVLHLAVPVAAKPCFGEITFRVHNGERRHPVPVIFRIQPLETAPPVKPEKKAAAAVQTEAAPGISPSETDNVQHDEPATAQGRTEPVAVPAVSEPAQNARPSTPSSLPTMPAACIAVLRRGVLVNGLTVAIPLDRTVRIGRSSATHGVMDLDLCGQFESETMEKACSHVQAEVFMRGGDVLIQNKGQNPLRLVGDDGSMADLPEVHTWIEHQIVALPGKLRLILTKGAG